jgi:hypothetical protein
VLGLVDAADGWVAERNDEIDALRDEFASERRRALAVALGPDEQEADVAPIFPAGRFQVAPKRFGKDLVHVLRIGAPRQLEPGHSAAPFAASGHATTAGLKPELSRRFAVGPIILNERTLHAAEYVDKIDLHGANPDELPPRNPRSSSS